MIKGLLKTIFVLAMLLVATQAFALGEGGGNTTINGCTLNTAYLPNNNMYIRFSANSYCGSIEVFDSQGNTHIPRSASNLSNQYYASSEENGVILVPMEYIAAGNPVTFTIRAHDTEVWSSYSQATVTYDGGLTTSCVLTNFSYDISSPGIPSRVDYDYIHYASPFSCIPVFNGVQYLNSPIGPSYMVGGVNNMVVWAVPAGLGVGSPGSYVSDFVSFNYPGGSGNSGNVPIVTLTANPTSGIAGVVNPTLTWSVSNSATSCMASGDWGGSKNTDGSEPAGVLYLAKTYTFTLTCANAYGQGSDDATVVVSPSITPVIDLIASAPSPTGATVNVAQNFTSTITNQGSTTTGSGFTNLFQISTSSDGANPTDYPVAGMSALAAGGSANTTRSITFPSVGAWYIRACADKSSAGNTGTINEINENNNCSMSTPWTLVTVTTPPSPDLIASNPTPITATAGVAQTFSSTITNSGALSTGSGFTNLFQISQSSTGASGVTSYAVPGMSALASGGYATTSQAITFASVGTWYIRACADKSSAADANGTIAEYVESNNCSDSTPWTAVNVTSQPVPVVTLTANPTTGIVNVVNPTLTWSATNNPTSCTASGDWSGNKTASGGSEPAGVLGTVKTYTFTLTCSNAYGPGVDDATVVVTGAGGIDLTAGAITPITAPVSTLTTFYSTIQNMGASATGAGFTNLFQTATAADGTGSADAGTTSVASSLAGGNSIQISKILSFGTVGTKYIRACADKDKNTGVGTIGETNEGNNCSAWTAINVVASGPDLVAAMPTTVGTPQVGVYSGLNSVITNQGNQSTGNSFMVKFEIDNDTDHAIWVYNLTGNAAVLAGNNTTSSVTSGSNYNYPTAGTYYARACADRNSIDATSIAETDENNNCSGWTSFYVGPTGTISGNPCVIASGASNCNSSVTWNTVNPTVTSVVKNSANTTITTANSGTMNMTVKYPSETFTLFNGSTTLASDVIQSSCVSGSSWNGTYCEVNSGNPGDECGNGATNYPECTLINNVCANGADNPPTCTVDNNLCLNGADNPPICTTVGATCLNGFTNPPTCSAKKPIFKEN